MRVIASSSSPDMPRWWQWALPLVLGVSAALLARLWRTPQPQPGHVGIFFMAAFVAARLATANRLVGTTASLASMATGLLIGSDPLGSVGLLLAGGIVDLALGRSFVWRSSTGVRAGGLAVVGAAGNLAVLGLKLAFGDMPRAALEVGLRATLRNNICYFQTMRHKVLSLIESPSKTKKMQS